MYTQNVTNTGLQKWGVDSQRDQWADDVVVAFDDTAGSPCRSSKLCVLVCVYDWLHLATHLNIGLGIVPTAVYSGWAYAEWSRGHNASKLIEVR